MKPMKKIAIDDRRYKVFQLKRIGMSNRAIADYLVDQGIDVSHTTVGKDWHKVLNDAVASRSDDINEMQELQHARLESMIHAHWAKATGWKLSQPGVNGDPDPRSAAIILRAIEDIRELYGLDNAVGTVENPLTLNIEEPEGSEYELDLSDLSDDELKRLDEIVGAIIEANDIATGNA